MKKFLTILACIAIVFVGGVTLAACGETPEEPALSTVEEFYDAINAQQDGDTIVLKAGEYDLDPTLSTLEYSGQTNWYLPILKNHVTIKGQGKVVLKSTHDTPNGAWATQNFLTVIGDNFTLQNVTIVCKKEVNKAIEVLGKNVTLRNVTFNSPEDYKFAGSIYFNNEAIASNTDKTVGIVTLENVNLNKGRITATGANTGKFIFKNVTIDWTDIEAEQLDMYPLYNLTQTTNTDSNFEFDGLSTLTVKMSETEMSDEYEGAQAELPQGLNLVNVDEN